MRLARLRIGLGAAIVALLVLTISTVGHAPTPHLSTRHEKVALNQVKVSARRPVPSAAPHRQAAPSIADITAYASGVSVERGQSIQFAVSTFSRTYDVYVQRYGASLTTVWERRGLAGRQQGYWVPGTFGVRGCPTCVISSETGEVEPNWRWSFSVRVPATWASGLYRVLLVTSRGEDVVPFVVRADSDSLPLLVVLSFNTYEAYNPWGGKSLYAYNSVGPTTAAETPEAAKVSFWRPYASWASTDFPLIGYGTASDWMLASWLAQHGLRADYTTDVDLARDPALANRHRALVFPGHQEYWSPAEFSAVQGARDHGVSLAFLSGNSVFWRVRYEDAYRTLVEYRDPALDPLKADQQAVTGLFSSPQLDEPQSTLTGTLYQSGVPGWLAWHLGTDVPGWLLTHTDLSAGSVIPSVVAGECDVFRANAPHPSNELIVGRAYFRGTGFEECDSTLYRAPSGAWVFNAGDMDWQQRLEGTTAVSRDVSQITANLLAKLAA